MADLTLFDALESWGVHRDQAEIDTPAMRRGVGNLQFLLNNVPIRVSVREQDHRLFKAWLASRPRPLTKEWLESIDENSPMTDDDYAFAAYIAKAWGRMRARPLDVPESIVQAEAHMGAPTSYGQDATGKTVVAIWENPNYKAR